MARTGTNEFDPLAEGLSPEQRSEFFQILHQTGITRQDVELARLLRALQLYKAFYQEIPARVFEAVKETDALVLRIKSLQESLSNRLDTALTQLERNVQVASTISSQFREAKSVITVAIEKATSDVALALDLALRNSLSAGLLKPFESFLENIEDQCGRTTGEAKQITLQLKQARSIHIGAYALAAAVIALALTGVLWFTAARHYTQREELLIQQIDRNRQVLSELARKGEVLEMQRDPDDSRKLYLLVKGAKAWTNEKYAVVELK